ncbi:MAG: metallophosphoesterase family protein, partial [Gemmataceae bacterium]|nr:metallophosphoesterase family protein [Gemmataceae bacterium]
MTTTRLLAALALLGPTLAPAPAAELRRGPYLQVPRPDGITVRWRTDPSVKHTSVLRYGTSPDKLDRAVAAVEAGGHFPNCLDWQATVNGLEPDTLYYYAIEADRAVLCGADERHRFRTSPKVGEARKLRFWLLGDSGSNRPRPGDLKAALAADVPDPIKVRNGLRKFAAGQPPDGIILLGDNAYPFGTDEQYQAALFNVYADELRAVPLWPCTGNHDMDAAYKYIFTTNADGKAGGRPSGSPFYYAADVGNLHLVVLDPWKCWLEETEDEAHLPWKRQLDWLEKDLASTRQQWVWAVQHFPPYCDGNYNSDSNGPLVKLRQRLVPLFDEF